MSDDIQLYPEERNKIISVWADAQKKFIGKDATKQNLMELATYAEGEFHRAGFKVIVDVSNIEFGTDGNPYYSPIVNVVDRVNHENNHDHERHAFEVQQGEEDGIAGKITREGDFVAPDLKVM